jgi:hypothetical protein
MFAKPIQFLKNLFGRHASGTWAKSPPVPVSTAAVPAAGCGGAPRNRQVNGYMFSAIQNDQVDNTVDTISIDGTTLEINHQQQRVVTVNNHVVRPAHIASRCETCGGYSELIVHCDRCSKSVCFRHASGVETPQGILCLCDECRGIAIENWNTWSAEPGYRFPKPPVAVAKLFSAKGFVHENEDGTDH